MSNEYDLRLKVVIDIENQEFFKKMKKSLKSTIFFDENSINQVGVGFYLLKRTLNSNGECVIDKNGEYHGDGSEEIKVIYNVWLLNNEPRFNKLNSGLNYINGASFVISDKEKYQNLNNLIVLKDDENPFHELFKKTVDLKKKPLESYLINY